MTLNSQAYKSGFSAPSETISMFFGLIIKMTNAALMLKCYVAVI